MGKKIEAYAVVDANSNSVYDIVQDLVENTMSDEVPSTLEEAQVLLNEIRGKGLPYLKIVKITTEEITTLEDAIAYQAGA